MRKVARRVGVCSWSLRPNSLQDLVRDARAAGVYGVQLALAPLRDRHPAWRDARERLRAEGIEILSAMMSTRDEDYSTLESIRLTGGLRPDQHWAENRRIAGVDARTARDLGVSLVTLHAGFLPHDAVDPERAKLVARLREIVDVFAADGVRVGFETGQETAETLLDVLHELDRPSAGVNFDPANMILYGMGDPVAALVKLAPRVLQVHVKDALPPRVPGQWGSEVAAGGGAVDWTRFFAVLDAAQPAVDLVIEREAGSDRVADVRRAREWVGRFACRAGERA